VGLLARFMAATPSGDPFDDRYYTGGSVVVHDRGTAAATAEPERIATVFRAVNVLAGAVASLPVDVFRYVNPERPQDGKRVAFDLAQRDLLRRRPNGAQTSHRWRHHMVGTVVLGGNYFAQKVGPYGRPPAQLFPFRQGAVEVADVAADGTLVYKFTPKAGAPRFLTSDEVLHVRGYSRDGFTGVSVVDLMRDTSELALSNRTQRKNFVKNEMRPSVTITHPTELSEAARTNILNGYVRAFGGPTRAGKPLLLEEGAKVEPFQITSRDAQYIESEHFLIEEFLRFLGVPGVLVGHADKTSTYASAEQFFQSFVTHGLYPLVSNLEEELTAALLASEPDAFVEFNLDGMLRPDSTARSAFYRVMVELGVFTRNEVRAMENRNPLPGLDEPLTPANMNAGNPAASAPAPARRSLPAPAADPADADAPVVDLRVEVDDQATPVVRALLERVLTATAGRLVRKEVAALQSLARRYAADPAGWREKVAEFYGRHVDLLVDDLALDPEAARGYVERQQTEALADLASIETWPATRPEELVDLALESAASAA
jgi:HK97 family phage portal protein